MGKTIRHYFDHIRLPANPPTRIMKSGREYKRDWDYQLVNSEWDEDIIDPEEDRKEEHIGKETG